MIAGERPSFTLETDQAACLPLFANILVRLELRFAMTAMRYGQRSASLSQRWTERRQPTC